VTSERRTRRPRPLDNRVPTQALTVLLLSRLNTATKSGANDEAEGAVVDVGKIGEAAVLELGAKGLLKGLVHKGHVRVLEDRGFGDARTPQAGKDNRRVIDHHGIVIAVRHVNVGNGLERDSGVLLVNDFRGTRKQEARSRNTPNDLSTKLL
jgi:hypothetical protein